MKPAVPHPDQLALDLNAKQEIERIIEVRVSERAEADAFRWRLRLVMIETLMMGGLVAAAGLVLHQPLLMVVRSAVVVAGACFASGFMLIGLSGASGWCLSRVSRLWKTRGNRG